MKVKDLLPALTLASKVITSRQILPILDYVLIDGKQIISGDLQNYLSVDIPEKLHNKPFLVHAALLEKVLKAAKPDDKITFSPDEKNIEIKIGKNNLVFGAEVPGDFPKTPTVDPEEEDIQFHDVDVATITKAIKFTSKDELRPAMTGIFLDRGRIVSTDSHRLMVGASMADFESAVIIHKSTASLFSKLNGMKDGFKAFFSPTYSEFKGDGISMVSRIIDERFPDYMNVWPNEDVLTNEVTLDRKELIDVLKMCLPVANKTTYQVILQLGTKDVKISAEDLDYTNSIERKMQALATSSDEKTIKLRMTSNSNKPLVVDEDLLLMPIVIGHVV